MSYSIHVDVSVPEPVVNLTAIAVNSSSLEVTWNHSGEGNVDVFRVWAHPSNNSSEKPPEQSPKVSPDSKGSYSTYLKDLTPGEMYTVYVSAGTAEQPGGESNPQSVEAKTSKSSTKLFLIFSKLVHKMI